MLLLDSTLIIFVIVLLGLPLWRRLLLAGHLFLLAATLLRLARLFDCLLALR